MGQQYEVVAGGAARGAWGAEMHVAAGASVIVLQCGACGALVVDQARHDAWHDQLGATASP